MFLLPTLTVACLRSLFFYCIYRDEKFEEMKEFEEEREKLMSLHDKKMAELQNKYLKDKVELEQGFNADLTRLRNKYAPKA